MKNNSWRNFDENTLISFVLWLIFSLDVGGIVAYILWIVFVWHDDLNPGPCSLILFHPLIFYNVNFSFESFLSIRCLIRTLLRQFPTLTKTITKLQFHYCLSSLLLELVRIQWQFFCIYFVQIVYMIYEIITLFSY